MLLAWKQDRGYNREGYCCYNHTERDVYYELFELVAIVTIQEYCKGGGAVRSCQYYQTFGQKWQKHFYANKGQDKGKPEL